MPHSPDVIPTLRYRDAVAAIEFLTNALGFKTNFVHEGEGGVIDHAQMTFGNGMIMLGTTRGDMYDSHASVYLIVEDPDSYHDRAVAAGADIAMPLTDQDYGSREFSVRDPEGNVWAFGTYRPEM